MDLSHFDLNSFSTKSWSVSKTSDISATSLSCCSVTGHTNNRQQITTSGWNLEFCTLLNKNIWAYTVYNKPNFTLKINATLDLPHSCKPYSSGKLYIWSGTPSGSRVSFWVRILWAFHNVALNVSSCFCSIGIIMNAKRFLKKKSKVK